MVGNHCRQSVAYERLCERVCDACFIIEINLCRVVVVAVARVVGANAVTCKRCVMVATRYGVLTRAVVRAEVFAARAVAENDGQSVAEHRRCIDGEQQ